MNTALSTIKRLLTRVVEEGNSLPVTFAHSGMGSPSLWNGPSLIGRTLNKEIGESIALRCGITPAIARCLLLTIQRWQALSEHGGNTQWLQDESEVALNEIISTFTSEYPDLDL